MRTHNCTRCSAIFLLVVSLIFSGFAPGSALSAESRSSRAAASQVPARLVIKRVANLGWNVIVQLWIDGKPAGLFGYGHTYNGTLTPGRHVLAVMATRQLSPTPWQMALNAQSGQTYVFTAQGGPSGNLVLATGF